MHISVAERLLADRGFSPGHPADVLFVARRRLPSRRSHSMIRPHIVLIRRDTVHALWREDGREWPRDRTTFVFPPPGALGPRQCVLVDDGRERAELVDGDGFKASAFQDLTRHLRNFESIEVQTVGWAEHPHPYSPV